METTPKRINIEVEERVWRYVGMMAAELGMTKKEIVNVALLQYWAMHKELKK